MNFLSIFVLIPLLMLAGLWAARGIKAIRGVMVTGASALLIASVVLTFMYLGERSAGNTAEMLFRADTLWYAPLHISYSVGVDGISVAMLLLSAIIVFTGTFASWRLQPLTFIILEFLYQPIDDYLVEVIAPQVSVTIC